MRYFLAIAMLGVALLFPRALEAQSYSINWHTIGAGGGTSSGTNGSTSYTVAGTIGQPATAAMSGGAYSVTGGFWSIISTIQTAGAPVLSILQSGSQAIISWSESAGGYLLEQSASLLPASWTVSSAAQTTNDGVISVAVPATSGYQFFRLHNP